MLDLKKSFKKRRVKDPGQVQDLLSFLSIAYKDYLASRVLFNKDLLSQACILANTAIEKYFKAVITVHGNACRGHNVSGKLLQSVCNYDKSLGGLLNKEFIELICRSYKMRYLDNLPVGFNISIVKNKTLAELDYMVSEIYKRFDFEKGGKKIALTYQTDIRKQNQLLWENNYVLNKQDKTQFLNREDSVYEMRVLEGKKILEATYKVAKVDNDGVFLKEALKPGGK